MKSTNTTSGKNLVEKSVNKPNLFPISHPEKIYWPDLKITKGMLADYYREISDFIFPFIKNRLHSLHRYPDGINGESFYHKNIDPDSLPAGLQTHTIKRATDGKDIHYFVCNSKEALLYMVNLGCIEINPWNNTIASYFHPDWLVLDLDPESIPFKEVVHTALEIYKFFTETGIRGYVKTSGSTGLHIYIPTAKKYTYDEVRSYAKNIAQVIHQRLPQTTSLERAPTKRQNKVYIDYLQNSHGQTVAAPFSVRPKPLATVSMPLEWEELTPGLTIEKFTMKNLFKRAEKAYEIWKPVLGRGVNLQQKLAGL